MERNAVQRQAGFRILIFLDLDTVRIVRAHLVQSDDVQKHQSHQGQRQCNDVERKKTIQGDIGDDKVAAYPLRQGLADTKWNSGE